MHTKLMWLRSLTAVVLFLFLTEANTWASTQAHLVLAVGYRTLLITAPFFMAMGLRRSMPAAVGLGVLSLFACFWQINEVTLGLFALSMAVTGYLAKFVSSHSSQGAADNKVALNLGSLFSGALLIFVTNKQLLLSISVLMLVACLILAIKIDWDSLSALEKEHSGRNDKNSSDGSKKYNFKSTLERIQIIPLLGWLLIGIATGIKLTGIFTVLPQHLLLFTKHLPSWFGSLIIVNSIGVVLIQHRVLKWLDTKPSYFTHYMALSSLLLLALPGILKTESFLNALAWVILLTLGECALSRYDRLSKEDGYLFPKEIMVGVGSFATVALSRHWPTQIFWSGFLGVACFLLGLFLVRGPSKALAINK